MANLSGQIIGGYELRALIGHGGMGDVYYGVETATGHAVAVKCFKSEIASGDAELLERFAREGEVLRQLNHPNIVKVLATIDDKDRHYIVMEYVAGGSLRQLLDQESRLPVDRVLSIALDLADALTRAHRLNIIHRDIKPANVLLAEDGTPRLSDFGVAYLGHKPRVTKADAVMGTLDYLSPESLNGEEVDGRTDIWAFGIMLYEMLAGRRPFDERTAGATAMAILQKQTPDLENLRPDIPVALVDLVYRMLEKDRHARIASIRLVGAELEAISKGTDVGLPVVHRTAEDGRSVFGTTTSVTGVARHNLPALTTPFIGRHTELVELAQLLADPNVRLITILGLGGMGKTRLALEAAGAQTREFTHGVYFVSLASVSSVDSMIAYLAEAINFHFYQGEELKQQLVDYLREKDMLLLIDSCDHLMEGAGLIADILRHAPNVKVLATSREKLNLYGETVYMIGGLALPDKRAGDRTPEYDAIRLFVQSARRAQSTFDLRPSDYPHAAAICQLVEGMPLGIELAAAWVGTLSLQEITEEIGQSLDFLETEESDIPERHRSIRAVFEYTWNRLDSSEQSLMKMLAVFRAGCTRKAAQKVTGASLQQLTSLVNRSLLRRTQEGRYEVQQLLRQRIEEKLNESPDECYRIRHQHALYYSTMLDEQEIPLRGADQKTIVADIAADLKNIRGAWRWAVTNQQPAIIGKALHSLYTFYLIEERGQQAEELFELAAQTLRQNSKAPDSQLVLGRLLIRHGWLTGLDKTERFFREGLDLLRPFDLPEETAFGALGLGSALLRSNLQEARQCLEEGLALYQSTGNRWGERIALFWMGFLANAEGNTGEAKRLFQVSLDMAEQIKDGIGAMMCFQQLGNTARARGEYEEANKYFKQGLVLAREIGVKGDIARGLRSLGNIARARREYTKADQYLHESLEGYRELGNRARIARVLYELGDTARLQGRYEQARELFRESLNTNQALGFLSGSLSSMSRRGDVPDEKQQYSERLYQEASRQEGEAYALIGLGGAACGLGNTTEAQQHLQRALQIATQTGTISLVLIALAALAELLAQVGKPEKSIELCAFVYHAANWQETKDRVKVVSTGLGARLSPAKFSAAYKRGQAFTLEEAVAPFLEGET